MDENEDDYELYCKQKMDFVRNINFYIHKYHNDSLLSTSDILGMLYCIGFDYATWCSKHPPAVDAKEDNGNFGVEFV